MLEKGQKVSLEYTVFLEDGTQIDTNIGSDPLVFVFGAKQVFPALEEAIVGLSAGDTKEIKLKAEEAYGPIVEDAFRDVDLETIPLEHRKEGAILGLQDPQGGVYPVRVHQIKEEKATLDFNHPLAGKDLRFDVKVIQAN